jgi:SAM-dependent methyltransferase
MSDHRLFRELAHRYDAHTPPHHYQDDHAFVLELARGLDVREPSLLDVGCGTGVFLEKARAAGMRVSGIDASPAMIDVCAARLGAGIARTMRMEDLGAPATYDVVTALSWTLNYVESDAALDAVVERLVRSLRPRGLIVLQVAHAENASGEVFVDTEPVDDAPDEAVTLIYRFEKVDGTTLAADYVYARTGTSEFVTEKHLLHAASVGLVVDACRRAALASIEVFDSWRKEAFARAISPFVIGRAR